MADFVVCYFVLESKQVKTLIEREKSSCHALDIIVIVLDTYAVCTCSHKEKHRRSPYTIDGVLAHMKYLPFIT